MTILDTIENLGFSTWVSESKSLLAYPTILWLHVMGMGVVVGFASLISMRILGIARKLPLQALEGLFPWIWFGFWLNAATGTALLMASATKRVPDPTFWIKMVFVFVGLVVLQRTRKTVFANLGPEGKLPPNAKPLAWAALVCWLGALTAGRLLAYI
jgi:hypothetical protein